ncbi:MAG: hypothetical protein ACM3SY_17520 [Candidatus Omnitrophota bacterium]
MRRFNSYGPINNKLHYYAPRQELIENAYTNLVGEVPDEGGHYFTVWASRQTGKTWLMRETIKRIDQTGQYHQAIISMDQAKAEKEEKKVVSILIEKMQIAFSRQFPRIQKINEIPLLFTASYFQKPVILILDEFDGLEEEWINGFVAIFRDMFISRVNEWGKTSNEKHYLLHGLALIGVRSVLGIENPKGSPFNVQRSFRVPNLTDEEVAGMFQWYERESGQKVEESVIRALFNETLGHPGLTCWFGELLTETYNPDKNQPIDMNHFNKVYGAATHTLPNNTILNLISKVNKPPYEEMVMELFKTGAKIEFKFNNKDINYLYMNGVIAAEETDIGEYYVKFSCPFVQKSLFDYFSNQIFNYMGQLIQPLDTMNDAIDDQTLHVPNIIQRYRTYLKKNGPTFFKDVPRRKTDLKIYEAVYHFNLYRYLYDLLKPRGVDVVPQFPTGNGKIDLILKYRGKVQALELKGFRDMYTFEKGIDQAASYGRQLGLTEIVYLVFVELSEEDAKQLEQAVEKGGIKVIVVPVGIL